MKLTGTHSLTLFRSKPGMQYIAPQQRPGLSLSADSGATGAMNPMPVEADFHQFVYRHLSATVVGGGSYKATDFSNEQVLKDAVGKLQGKPAYKNHFMYVGNEIGSIGTTVWRDAYTNAQGAAIPGGIEAPFVIDAVLEPRIVRQLNSPNSPVSCCSVTVDFDWVASHEFEREYDFYRHLGEMVDGTMVRRIATRIIDFYESSLVWLGADPYAKMLVNGELRDVSLAEESGAFAKDLPIEQVVSEAGNKYYVVEGPRPTASLSMSAARPGQPAITPPAAHEQAPINPATPPAAGTEQFSTSMNEALVFLALQLGITQEQLTSFSKEQLAGYKLVKTDEHDTLSAEHTARGNNITQLTSDKTALQGQVDTLTKEKETLTTEKGTLSADAALGKQVHGQLLAEARRAYGLFSKGQPDSAILGELDTATVTSLNAKIKMWGGANLSEFGASCSKCGSADHIQMRTTEPEPTTLGGKTEEAESYSLAERFRR